MLNMKKRIHLTKVALTLLIALLQSLWGQDGQVWADNVTAEQALRQAQAFVKNHPSATGARRTPGTTPQLTLARQVCGLYVFNVAEEGGFVIVANDDEATPILGFSDSGHIDEDNMPENMLAWLQGYADQIAWLQKQTTRIGQTTQSRAPRRTAKANIAPLVSTQWNQGAPYNNLCPEYQEGRRAVTGCVATAMAQVMNYHRWPTAQTEDIPGYTTGSYKIDLTAGLPAVTFDWANMANSYKGETTDAQKTAVATLMRYCGQSVRMNYGPSSGASSAEAAIALKNYFGYKETTQFVSRSFYTYANWVDLIYHELSENRPVLYGGQSSGGGHEFVCDGYKFENSTDYFHINWGWGGSSDNYFVLSALNPHDQGIGGSESDDGYNFGQDAIVGIQKPSGTGTVLDVASTVNLTINSITLSKTSAVHGETVTVTVNVRNNSTDAYDGELILIANGETNHKMFYINGNTTTNCTFNYTPEAAGTYTFYCAIPSKSGGYHWDSYISATLRVDDTMPSDLAATDISFAEATIGWTSSDTKWNMKYRPLTITETNFSEGIPTGWRGRAQGGDYWIYTPTITLGGSITFWAGGEGTSGSFRVYYYNSSTGYYSSVSQQFTVTSTRKEYTVDLSKISGTTNLAIIIDDVSENTPDIDDFTIVEPGSWTNINDITENPYTLTGLTPETHYELQVQGVVGGGGTTTWSDPLVFSTLNITPTNLSANPTNQSALISWTGNTNNYSLRYRTKEKGFFDGFEDGLHGWTVYTNGEGQGWKTVLPNQTNAHEGNSVASAYSWNGDSYHADNWLITPRVKLQGLLKFWEYTNSGFPDSYEVLLSTTGNNTADFTTTLRAMTTATGSWSEVQIDLSAYEGQQGYIAIHHVSYDCNYLYIDDFSIGYTPVGEWTNIKPAECPTNITGLMANTEYEYQIDGIYKEIIATSKTAIFTTTDNASFELKDNSTKNSTLIAAWNGLQTTVTLAGRTLYKDGEWNTICLPFNVVLAGSPLAGATAKTLKSATMTGSIVGLTFGDDVTTLQAGVPYIIKWAKDTEHPTLTESDLVFNDVTVVSSSAADRTITAADGHVKFIGYYDAKNITTEDDDIYYMTAGNTLKHTGKARTLKACRTYFQFSEAAASRQFVMDFGDGDATRLINNEELIINKEADAWYTLDGRKVNVQSSMFNGQLKKGVYIHNGRKEVLK